MHTRACVHTHTCMHTYHAHVKSSVGPHFTTSRAAVWSKLTPKWSPVSPVWPLHFPVAPAILCRIHLCLDPITYTSSPAQCSLASTPLALPLPGPLSPSTVARVLSIRSLPNCHLICEASLTTLYKISFFLFCPTTLSCFIFLYSTYPHNIAHIWLLCVLTN